MKKKITNFCYVKHQNVTFLWKRTVNCERNWKRIGINSWRYLPLTFFLFPSSQKKSENPKISIQLHIFISMKSVGEFNSGCHHSCVWREEVQNVLICIRAGPVNWISRHRCIRPDLIEVSTETEIEEEWKSIVSEFLLN